MLKNIRILLISLSACVVLVGTSPASRTIPERIFDYPTHDQPTELMLANLPLVTSLQIMRPMRDLQNSASDKEVEKFRAALRSPLLVGEAYDIAFRQARCWFFDVSRGVHKMFGATHQPRYLTLIEYVIMFALFYENRLRNYQAITDQYWFTDKTHPHSSILDLLLSDNRVHCVSNAVPASWLLTTLAPEDSWRSKILSQ